MPLKETVTTYSHAYYSINKNTETQIIPCNMLTIIFTKTENLKQSHVITFIHMRTIVFTKTKKQKQKVKQLLYT
jgi:hypothetical protein